MEKELFRNTKYIDLSVEAKVIYAFMKDRNSLSASNKERWMDEKGTFIYFTIQEVQERVKIGHDKASKIMKELEEHGLVIRERQGLGRPCKVYVQDLDYGDAAVQNEDNKTPGRGENQKSGSLDIQMPGIDQTVPNNTYGNKPDLNSPHHNKMTYDMVREELMDNIGYEWLESIFPKACVDAVLQIMIDAVCNEAEKTKIDGAIYSTEIVRSRIRNLDPLDVEYVLNSIMKGNKLINYPKAYILSRLYSAPSEREIHNENQSSMYE